MKRCIKKPIIYGLNECLILIQKRIQSNEMPLIINRTWPVKVVIIEVIVETN